MNNCTLHIGMGTPWMTATAIIFSKNVTWMAILQLWKNEIHEIARYRIYSQLMD